MARTMDRVRVQALRTTCRGTVRPRMTTVTRPRRPLHRAAASTRTVTTFTPQAVDPAHPPMTMNSRHTAWELSYIPPWGKRAKPAVRRFTDWKRAAVTFSPAVMAPRVAGLDHSAARK